MISRLPFFNHNAIESSTSSANAEAASMTDAFNLDVGGNNDDVLWCVKCGDTCECDW